MLGLLMQSVALTVTSHPGGIKTRTGHHDKKAATVAPRPRFAFSSAAGFAGGDALLKLYCDLVGRRA
jgi:hypothetical protein